MSLFIVVTEDKEGMWWNDPEGFDTQAEAEKRARQLQNPKGHVHVVYECRQVACIVRTEK